MMDLPRLKKTIDGRRSQRATTFNQTLGGYNHNLRTKAGEFFDMKNISLDDYPVIGTRQGVKAIYPFYDLSGSWIGGLHEYKENTLMAANKHAASDPAQGYSQLIVGITEQSRGTFVSNSRALLSGSDKSFATIGTKTLIMPDKAIYDSKTETLYKFEKTYQDQTIEIENPQTTVFLRLRTLPCDIDGTVNWNIVESTSEPSNPVDGMWWYNYGEGAAATAASSDPNAIVETLVRDKGWYEYDADGSEWVKLEKPYTILVPCLSTSSEKYIKYATALDCLEEINDFFTSLNVFDSFGMKLPYLLRYENEYTDYAIYGKKVMHNEDWDLDLCGLVIAKQATTNITGFKIGIRCPELEHIFALNNRIWGVNPEEHEIFCCKLGDPTQWYNYAGVASDSFAVSLGNDKEITAGCAYNNNPHFFTEDSIIRIYGDYPSNYQLYTTKADGVVLGSHDSLVQVQGSLFWLSPVGVVAYEGSLPYPISQDFEPNFFSGKTAVAGKDGTKYCISVMHKSATGYTYYDGIFVYDTLNGMWSKIDNGVGMIKTEELKNALCFYSSQKRFVMLHDRSMTKDFIQEIGSTNKAMVSGRTETDSFELDNRKCLTAVGIGNGTNEGITIESGMIDVEIINGSSPQLKVIALQEYWNDAELKSDFGATLPIIVGPNEEYEVDYFTTDPQNAFVCAAAVTIDGQYIKRYLDIKTGEIIQTPENAHWLLLSFGQRSTEKWNSYQVIGCRLVYPTVGKPANSTIEWMLETGNLGLDTPNQKYISRVQMRIDFIGSLNVDISYDDSEYFPVHVSQSDHMKSITVPIKVRRCDHFKLKLSGEGWMRLYSLGYETDEGSARCLI